MSSFFSRIQSKLNAKQNATPAETTAVGPPSSESGRSRPPTAQQHALRRASIVAAQIPGAMSDEPDAMVDALLHHLFQIEHELQQQQASSAKPPSALSIALSKKRLSSRPSSKTVSPQRSETGSPGPALPPRKAAAAPSASNSVRSSPPLLASSSRDNTLAMLKQMLLDCPQTSCQRLHDTQAAAVLYSLVHQEQYREGALACLSLLTVQSNVSDLVEQIQLASRQPQLLNHLLQTATRLLELHSTPDSASHSPSYFTPVKTWWRQSGGIESTLSLIARLENAFAPPSPAHHNSSTTDPTTLASTQAQSFATLTSLLTLLTSAQSSHAANHDYVWRPHQSDCQRDATSVATQLHSQADPTSAASNASVTLPTWLTLTQTLRMTRALQHPLYCCETLQCVMDMATGSIVLPALNHNSHHSDTSTPIKTRRFLFATASGDLSRKQSDSFARIECAEAVCVLLHLASSCEHSVLHRVLESLQSMLSVTATQRISLSLCCEAQLIEHIVTLFSAQIQCHIHLTSTVDQQQIGRLCLSIIELLAAHSLSPSELQLLRPLFDRSPLRWDGVAVSPAQLAQQGEMTPHTFTRFLLRIALNTEEHEPGHYIALGSMSIQQSELQLQREFTSRNSHLCIPLAARHAAFLLDSFSLCVWIRLPVIEPANASNYNGIQLFHFASSAAPNVPLLLCRIDGAGTLSVALGAAQIASTCHLVSFGACTQHSTWTHIVLSYDRQKSTKGVSAFSLAVDAQYVQQIAVTGDIQSLMPSGGADCRLTIGGGVASDTQTGGHFDLNNCLCLTGLLPPSELQLLYESGPFTRSRFLPKCRVPINVAPPVVRSSDTAVAVQRRASLAAAEAAQGAAASSAAHTGVHQSLNAPSLASTTAFAINSALSNWSRTNARSSVFGSTGSPNDSTTHSPGEPSGIAATSASTASSAFEVRSMRVFSIESSKIIFCFQAHHTWRIQQRAKTQQQLAASNALAPSTVTLDDTLIPSHPRYKKANTKFSLLDMTPQAQPVTDAQLFAAVLKHCEQYDVGVLLPNAAATHNSLGLPCAYLHLTPASAPLPSHGIVNCIPITATVERCGGAQALLAMIDGCITPEQMTHAVAFLCAICCSSASLQLEMLQFNGWEALQHLLLSKSKLVQPQCFESLLALSQGSAHQLRPILTALASKVEPMNRSVNLLALPRQRELLDWETPFGVCVLQRSVDSLNTYGDLIALSSLFEHVLLSRSLWCNLPVLRGDAADSGTPQLLPRLIDRLVLLCGESGATQRSVHRQLIRHNATHLVVAALRPELARVCDEATPIDSSLASAFTQESPNWNVLRLLRLQVVSHTLTNVQCKAFPMTSQLVSPVSQLLLMLLKHRITKRDCHAVRAFFVHGMAQLNSGASPARPEASAAASGPSRQRSSSPSGRYDSDDAPHQGYLLQAHKVSPHTLLGHALLLTLVQLLHLHHQQTHQLQQQSASIQSSGALTAASHPKLLDPTQSPLTLMTETFDLPLLALLLTPKTHSIIVTSTLKLLACFFFKSPTAQQRFTASQASNVSVPLPHAASLTPIRSVGWLLLAERLPFCSIQPQVFEILFALLCHRQARCIAQDWQQCSGHSFRASPRKRVDFDLSAMCDELLGSVHLAEHFGSAVSLAGSKLSPVHPQALSLIFVILQQQVLDMPLPGSAITNTSDSNAVSSQPLPPAAQTVIDCCITSMELLAVLAQQSPAFQQEVLQHRLASIAHLLHNAMQHAGNQAQLALHDKIVHSLPSRVSPHKPSARVSASQPASSSLASDASKILLQQLEPLTDSICDLVTTLLWQHMLTAPAAVPPGLSSQRSSPQGSVYNLNDTSTSQSASAASAAAIPAPLVVLQTALDSFPLSGSRLSSASWQLSLIRRLIARASDALFERRSSGASAASEALLSRHPLILTRLEAMLELAVSRCETGDFDVRCESASNSATSASTAEQCEAVPPAELRRLLDFGLHLLRASELRKQAALEANLQAQNDPTQFESNTNSQLQETKHLMNRATKAFDDLLATVHRLIIHSLSQAKALGDHALTEHLLHQLVFASDLLLRVDAFTPTGGVLAISPTVCHLVYYLLELTEEPQLRRVVHSTWAILFEVAQPTLTRLLVGTDSTAHSQAGIDVMINGFGHFQQMLRRCNTSSNDATSHLATYKSPDKRNSSTAEDRECGSPEFQVWLQSSMHSIAPHIFECHAKLREPLTMQRSARRTDSLRIEQIQRMVSLEADSAAELHRVESLRSQRTAIEAALRALQQRAVRTRREQQYAVQQTQQRLSEMRISMRQQSALLPLAWCDSDAADCSPELVDWMAAGHLPCERWRLQNTEGPFRQRKKLERHRDFYSSYAVQVPDMKTAIEARIKKKREQQQGNSTNGSGAATTLSQPDNNSTLSAPLRIDTQSRQTGSDKESTTQLPPHQQQSSPSSASEIDSSFVVPQLPASAVNAFVDPASAAAAADEIEREYELIDRPTKSPTMQNRKVPLVKSPLADDDAPSGTATPMPFTRQNSALSPLDSPMPDTESDPQSSESSDDDSPLQQLPLMQTLNRRQSAGLSFDSVQTQTAAAVQPADVELVIHSAIDASLAVASPVGTTSHQWRNATDRQRSARESGTATTTVTSVQLSVLDAKSNTSSPESGILVAPNSNAAFTAVSAAAATPAETSPEAAQQLTVLERLLRLLAPNESVLADGLFACSRIAQLDAQPALLVLTQQHLYVFDAFTLSEQGELIQVDSIQDAQSSSLPTSSVQSSVTPVVSVLIRDAPSVWQSTCSPSNAAATAAQTAAEAKSRRQSTIVIANQQQLLIEQQQKRICQDNCLDVVLHVEKPKKARNSAGMIEEPQQPQQTHADAANSTLDLPSLRWPLLSVRDVHKRRYQLQPCGLELFDNRGESFLVALRSKEQRNAVYNQLQQLLNESHRPLPAAFHAQALQYDTLLQVSSQTESRSGVIRTSSNSILQRSVTERWIQGEMSNFAYLMFLNTLSGRSFNDLTQYHVFPMVLSDYTSSDLDLNDPRVFRDLSLPMGAIGAERAQQFAARYKNWDDPHIPPFHFGSHYSSAAVVLYYLIRMEPFTRIAVALQGGKFDLSDRLFHNLSHTYASASSKGGLSDVKESIPELFTTPEIFVNSQRWDLGEHQRGYHENDVQLPPWAKGDARLFVRLHRRALESPHVSANLHHWIDLIFGSKQRGKAAAEALNVFYHTAYSGAIDISAITDPLERASTIMQINEFGQTPQQLFKRPHPQRNVASHQNVTIASHPHLLHQLTPSGAVAQLPASTLSSASPTPTPTSAGSMHLPQLKSRVNSLLYLAKEDRLLALECGQSFVASRLSKYLSFATSDATLRFCVLLVSPRHRQAHQVAATHELLHSGGHASITQACVTDSGELYITGGSDGLINLWRAHAKLKHRQLSLSFTLYGHVHSVTHLVPCVPYAMLISGSRDDAAVVIWNLANNQLMRRLPRLSERHPLTALACHNLTGDIAVCCVSHIAVFSLNGELIAHTVLPSPLHDAIHSCTFTHCSHTDEDLLLTGHADGSIRFWQLIITEKDTASTAQSTTTKPQNSVHFKVNSNASTKTSASSSPHKPAPREDSSSLALTPRRPLPQSPAVASAASIGPHQKPTSSSSRAATPDNLFKNPLLNQVDSVPTPASSRTAASTPLPIAVPVQSLQSIGSPSPSPAAPALVSLSSPRVGVPFMHFSLRHKLVSAHASAVSCLHTSVGAPQRLFSGDAEGKVKAWTCSQHAHWNNDDAALVCQSCAIRFSLLERRHRKSNSSHSASESHRRTIVNQSAAHINCKLTFYSPPHCASAFNFSDCRRCGKVCCSACTKQRVSLREFGFEKPVRVCDACNRIQLQSESEMQPLADMTDTSRSQATRSMQAYE